MRKTQTVKPRRSLEEKLRRAEDMIRKQAQQIKCMERHTESMSKYIDHEKVRIQVLSEKFTNDRNELMSTVSTLCSGFTALHELLDEKEYAKLEENLHGEVDARHAARLKDSKNAS